MSIQFKKATKKQSRLRMAIQGPSGSGKTYSALRIASNLADKIAVGDTEYGSASLYASEFDFDVHEFRDNFHPDNAVSFLAEAAKAGYGAAIIDSVTHFWNGTGGFLELVDEDVRKQRARGGRGDSFAAWKEVTPVYNKLVHAILASPMHVFICMRAKQEYVKDTDERGKTVVRKVGLAAEMRDNFQYEMTVEGMLDMEHNLVIGKTRCNAIDGKIYHKPGKELADTLKQWLEDGAPAERDPKAEFNTWVKPYIAGEALTVDRVKAAVNAANGDYDAARDALMKEMSA